MRLGERSTSDQVLVVAEIGNNHEGNFDRAVELVRQAALAGVDAVKFQTYRTELFVSPRDPVRFDRMKRFELSHEQFRRLADVAEQHRVAFFSTPLDFESLKLLERIACAIKIASGDNDFLELVEAACKTGKPIIISSGMTNMASLRDVVEHAKAWIGDPQDLAVLHCVSSYPAPPEEIHLSVLPVLHRELACTVGYSDHTLGIAACVGAVALGARVIEKHFTLDKQQSSFRDHQLSADPTEMAELVRSIRAMEVLLGTPVKEVQPCEQEVQPLARRSVVAARDLPDRHLVERADLMCMRPRAGLLPGQETALVGRRLKRAILRWQSVGLEDVE